MYKRQYNVTLSGLGDGAHSIEIRVAGDYYNLNGDIDGNYICESNITVVVDSQTEPSTTVPEFPFFFIFTLFLGIFLVTIFSKKRICLKAYN
jgi:hypothetical protein